MGTAGVLFEMSRSTNFFVNIRGLCQGAGELCAASLHLQPDFIALVEMHLDSDSINPFLPMGYVVTVRKDRSSHGGGVMIVNLICLLMLLIVQNITLEELVKSSQLIFKVPPFCVFIANLEILI